MHTRLARSRRSRTIASAAALAVVASVAIVNMQPASAADPGLAAPHRVYPTVDTPMPFSGTDPISDDNRAISVSGMVEGPDCDTSAPLYDIQDCPRIQMDLNTGEAGLLALDGTDLVDGPDGDPDLDLLVHSSGAVITEHTEANGDPGLLFNFNGTEAQLNDVLSDLSFVPAPGYEERDTEDGALPNITILAIQGDNETETTEHFIYVKVESENLAPTLDAPVAPVPVAAGGDVDLDVDLAAQDVPSVIDPEMCNLTECGLPFENPGLVESDDQMLLVAWIPETDCGTFTNFGTFTSLGGATNTSVHGLLTNTPSGLGLTNDQALPIELSISPLALLLDLSGQQSPGNENTVFAGVGELDEVRHALTTLEYQAPSDDATCHLDYTVSDLGNNGLPLSYEGSSLDPGGDLPEPGYEVPNALGATTNIQFDVTDSHPDVTVEQTALGPLGDPAGPNKPASFTITFDEAIEPSSFTAADLDIDDGDATGETGILTPVSAGLVYTFTAEAGGDGVIEVNVPAGGVFAAGHDGDIAFDNDASTSADNEITWDSQGPDVTIDQKADAPAQADPTSTSPVVFTVEFSESLTTAPAQFDGSDIDLTGSTAGGTLVADVTQPGVDPSVFEVSVSGMTTSGDVIAVVEADAIVDQALNGNAVSTSTDNSVEWQAVVDTTDPDVTITLAGGQSTPTSTSPINFTATFTEPVAGFTDTDVSFAGSTAGGTLDATITGGPSVYDIAVTGMTTSGDVDVTIPLDAATDAAANGNTASNTATVAWQAVVDTTDPTVTVEQAGGQVDPTSTTPIDFTATFSEPVSGFATGDVSFSGSTVGGTLTGTVTGGPTIYTIAVTGMTTGGTVVASIPGDVATDAAANGNAASTSGDGSVTWVQPVDTTDPTVTIEQAGGQLDPTSTSPILFTATFSEPVSGFVDADVDLSGSTAGGTLVADVTGGPSTYTVAVSGMTTIGDVVAAIGAGAADDAASNPNEASTSTDDTVEWVQVVDTTDPTVTVEQAGGQADPTDLASVEFTVTFSEPVAGFTGADVLLTGSTAPGPLEAAVSGGPSAYTVTVTGMTGNGTVVASIPAGAATDASANGSEASTSADGSVTFDGAITTSTPGGDVTIVADGGVLTALTTQAPSVPPPAGFTFPFGELSFTATTAVDGLVTFTLTLPDTTDAYFKLVSGAWEAFTFDGETGAQIDGTTVTVTVRDNGRGDSNPTAGVVTDPAAPAKAVPGGGGSTTSTTATTATTNPSSTSTTAGPGGTTATTGRVGSGNLVRTGSDVGPVTVLGFALIAVGIVILARRRSLAG